MNNLYKKILNNIANKLIEMESRSFSVSVPFNKEVLLLRPDSLGDFILFLPNLFSYRRLFDDYRLCIVISPINLSIAKRMMEKGVIDDYILFDRRRFSRNFFYRRKFLFSIKLRSPEISFYPVFSRESAGDMIVKYSSAMRRIAVKGNNENENQNLFNLNDEIYNELICVPDNILNEQERNDYILNNFGGQSELTEIKNFIKNESLMRCGFFAKYGLKKVKYCVVAPGAGQKYRIWPIERFAQVINFITSRGIKVVIFGTSHEKHLAKEIISQTNGDVIDLTGETEIFDIANLLSESIFCFGNESAIVHLASLLRVPAICLMGGGHFGRFFPYGEKEINRIVFDKNMKCKNDNWNCAKNLKSNAPAPCISGIETEAAINEIKALLAYLKYE